MNKFKQFFTTKGFYVALTVGVVAFAVLMGVYEYRNNKEKFLGEGSTVDLNKSYADGEVAGDSDAQETGKDKATVTVKPSDKVATENDTKQKAESAEADKSNDVAKAEAGKANDTANAESVSENKRNEDSENQVEASENDNDKIETVSSSAAQADTGFDAEATFAWPIIGGGEIILPYSMDTTVYYKTLNVYKCNPGVLLKADEGEDVYAVYSGTVTSIEDTNEFGNTVTIDLGNGYIVKYGQLMNVGVNVGDKVSTGQKIAEIGAVSSYYENEGNNLYLELRKDDIPENPMSYIE